MMIKQRNKGWIVCIFFVVLCLLSGCSSKNVATTRESKKEANDTKHSIDVFAMDTYMTLTAYGENGETALEKAKTQIQQFDDMWSTGNEDSEIAKLNEKKRAKVSKETLTLIKKAKEIYESTEGAFNITIYPLMELWGFTTEDYQVPSNQEIEKILERQVDMKNVEIDEKTRIVTLKNDAKIDLGGIAKGYTSEKVAEIFKENGVESGVISLGGNVQAIGKKVDGSRWKVGIQPPKDSMDMVGTYTAAGESVITSGGYERYFEKNGKTYHHILDPTTGKPANKDLLSVTIVSKDGALADGLSTSLYVMGKEEAISYWKKHAETFDMILVDEKEKVIISEGIEDNFTSDYDVEVIHK